MTYTYTLGSLNMGQANLHELVLFLEEFTSFEHDFLTSALRNLKRDDELILMGEGGSIVNVTVARNFDRS